MMILTATAVVLGITLLVVLAVVPLWLEHQAEVATVAPTTINRHPSTPSGATRSGSGACPGPTPLAA